MAASVRGILAALTPRTASLPRYDRLHPHDGDADKSIWSSRAFRKMGCLAIFGTMCVMIILFLRGDYQHLAGLLPQQSPKRPGSNHPTTAVFLDHSNATQHLIVASYTEQNVTWLDKVPSQWQVYRYWMDDPNPPAGILPVPRNQGREAMAYLTYIIDNYLNLPDFMIFTHGHERSWHQVEPLHYKIRALNLTSLQEEDYISLRCGDQMGCEKQPYIDTNYPNWEGEAHMCDFWDTIMPNTTCPRYISYKCCAQHAVTRKAVQTRTLEEWTRIREPLLHDFSEYKVWGEGASDWLGGMFYEKFWHVLLGAGDEYCPSVEHCQQIHFSNAIVCDGDIDLTLFEGEVWKETKCVTAFDDLHPDAPYEPAIRAFHRVILAKLADIRGAAARTREKMQKMWKQAEKERLRKEKLAEEKAKGGEGKDDAEDKAKPDKAASGDAKKPHEKKPVTPEQAAAGADHLKPHGGPEGELARPDHGAAARPDHDNVLKEISPGETEEKSWKGSSPPPEERSAKGWK